MLRHVVVINCDGLLFFKHYAFDSDLIEALHTQICVDACAFAPQLVKAAIMADHVDLSSYYLAQCCPSHVYRLRVDNCFEQLAELFVLFRIHLLKSCLRHDFMCIYCGRVLGLLSQKSIN